MIRQRRGDRYILNVWPDNCYMCKPNNNIQLYTKEGICAQRDYTPAAGNARI